MRRHRLIWGGLPFFLLLTSLSPLDAETFIEDFTTDTYKDPVETTADWDTVAGELKLFPFSMTMEGYLGLGALARSVLVEGNRAYVAGDTEGLLVLDISAPASPAMLSVYNPPVGIAYDVAIAGRYAYLANADAGLFIVDISNDFSPTLVGSIATQDVARGVAVAGNHAFVADASEGLTSVYILDPTTPVLRGSAMASGDARAVALSGDHAFVAASTGGVAVFNISNPDNPALAAEFPGADARDIAIDGDHAFVADRTAGSGLLILDITNPLAPTLIATYEIVGTVTGIAVSGDQVAVSDLDGHVHVIDVTDVANPTLIDRISTNGDPRDVTLTTTMAYVADGARGIKLYKVRDLTQPTILASENNSLYSNRVIVSGNHAYTLEVTDGLEIWDISSPLDPVYINHLSPAIIYYRALDLSGDVVFIGSSADGSGAKIYSIDVSDPAAPLILDTFNTGSSNVWDLNIDGDELVVANDDKIRILSITYPESITQLGILDTPDASEARAVRISGDYAFVGTRNPSSLYVVDISNPIFPAIVASLPLDGYLSDIAVSGPYLLMAMGSGGLAIIDVSDPTTPQEVDIFAIAGELIDAIEVVGTLAFICTTSGDGAVWVIDFSFPEQLITVIHGVDLPGQTNDLTAAGGIVYVAGHDGLTTIRAADISFDSEHNRGQSLLVHHSSSDIRKLRLASTHTDSVSFRVTVSDGASWQLVPADNTWQDALLTGMDVKWKSEHLPIDGATNPSLSQLRLQWLCNTPHIPQMTDVPNDQGGQLRVFCDRSALDFAGEANQATTYYLWRRIDDAALREDILAHAMRRDPAADGLNFLSIAEEEYILSERRGDEFPPGLWEAVASFPALQQDQYIAVVPSIGDSTATELPYTHICSSVHTADPNIWYVGYPDSAYSVDNIFPSVPTGFAVAYGEGEPGNNLTWDESPDDDFHYFNVYRGSDPEFPADPDHLLHQSIETAWTDGDGSANHFYKLSAVDDADNESDTANAENVNGVSTHFSGGCGLVAPVSNPVYGAARIGYRIAQEGGHVRLELFSTDGRLVRTLFSGHRSAGSYTIIWNGRDDDGKVVASGVYLYRLRAPGFEQTRRLTLIR